MLVRSVVNLVKINQNRCYSSAVVAKKIIYAKKFVGEPKVTDFELVEEKLPALKDGEILTEAEYLSLDPGVRSYILAHQPGVTMIGSQIAKILESKNPKYPVGSYICGHFGWRSHAVVNPDLTGRAMLPPHLLPDYGNLPRSLGLGVLGLVGNTAYFGFLDICQPKEGETVVVTGAAGAVGSIVGQIAKIKGCRVIGFAGTDEKCQWLEKDLGFDKAINYKNSPKNLQTALKEAAPKGVDCYFDNVGGQQSAMIYNSMNLYGRISVCGAISQYNSETPENIPSPAGLFVLKQLKMEGFLVYRPSFIARYNESFKHLYEWVQSGKIKYQETVTQGFENTPNAFIDLLRGKNTGKAIVKA